jgi:hypothetical protein
LQKIVYLPNSHLDDVRVAHRKVAIRLGLLQLEELASSFCRRSWLSS